MTFFRRHANINVIKLQQDKAMTRNSTRRLKHRELLAGEKQWKEFGELASEHLPEMNKSRSRRCPPLYGADIRILRIPYPTSV